MESCKKDIIEQLRALIEKLIRLESDLVITKNIKNLLSLRLAEMGRRCQTNSQYSRRETLKLIVSSKSSFTVFGKLVCNVIKDNLNVYHWLKDKTRVILKFCKQEDCEQVFRVKNNLTKRNMANGDLPTVDLPDRVFINQSLCSCYWLLWVTRKKLYSKGKILGWYVLKRTVKNKLQENSAPLQTLHMQVLRKYFPKFSTLNVYQ